MEREDTRHGEKAVHFPAIYIKINIINVDNNKKNILNIYFLLHLSAP